MTVVRLCHVMSWNGIASVFLVHFVVLCVLQHCMNCCYFSRPNLSLRATIVDSKVAHLKCYYCSALTSFLIRLEQISTSWASHHHRLMCRPLYLSLTSVAFFWLALFFQRCKTLNASDWVRDSSIFSVGHYNRSSETWLWPYKHNIWKTSIKTLFTDSLAGDKHFPVQDTIVLELRCDYESRLLVESDGWGQSLLFL